MLSVQESFVVWTLFRRSPHLFLWHRPLYFGFWTPARAGSHHSVDPPAGVCTVLGDYPLPTWQRVSYFEVYVVSGEPNSNIVIGLATRPYPQWRFAGWDVLSIGYHCKGVIYVSTCDFEKEYSMPWGPESNEAGAVNGGPWQEEMRNIQVGRRLMIGVSVTVNLEECGNLVSMSARPYATVMTSCIARFCTCCFTLFRELTVFPAFIFESPHIFAALSISRTRSTSGTRTWSAVSIRD